MYGGHGTSIIARKPATFADGIVDIAIEQLSFI